VQQNIEKFSLNPKLNKRLKTKRIEDVRQSTIKAIRKSVTTDIATVVSKDEVKVP